VVARRSAAFCLVVAVSGCSFIGLRAPRVSPIGAGVECNDSNALPTIDAGAAAVIFLAGGVLTFFAVGLERNPDIQLDNLAIGGVPTVVISGLALASAISGFAKVSACREARHLHPPTEEYLERKRREDAETARVRIEAASRDPIVVALRATAARIARTGDCATTRSIGARVRRVAPDYYDAVFVKDEAIARCFPDARPPQRIVPRHEAERCGADGACPRGTRCAATECVAIPDGEKGAICSLYRPCGGGLACSGVGVCDSAVDAPPP
jgi:hypothetical protein